MINNDLYNKRTILYANNTLVNINNLTLTRTTTFPNNSTSYETNLNGLVKRINTGKYYNGKLSTMEIEDWRRQIQITF